ncbi:MAG: LacI family DNA-binding transcriptional regulator [Tepidisphaeraceae bacterium]
MAATLAQIASLANTHMSTVSLVLNGRQHHRVSKATREKIERIAQELNYRANRNAQGLVCGKTRTVALLLNRLTNPFYGAYVSMLETAFESVGLHVSPFETRSDNEREHELMSLYRQGVCDVIISLAHHILDFDGVVLGQPVIARINDYDGRVSAKCALSHVVVDYRPAMRQLMPHLHAAGFKRMGLVMHRNNEPYPARKTESRYAGMVRQLLDQSDIECGPMQQIVAHENDPLQSWFDAATTLLNRDPKIDVLLVHTMDQVVPVIAAAKQLGRTIGKDLGLVTFDDPPISEWLEGGITVVREPSNLVVEGLVELALACMDGTPEQRSQRVEAQLVTRASTRAVHV